MNKHYVYGAGTVGICDKCMATLDKRTVSSTSFGPAEQCIYCIFGSKTQAICSVIANMHSLHGRGDITQIVWDKPGYYGVGGIVVCKLQYGQAAYRITVMWDGKTIVYYRGRKRVVKGA